MIPELLLIAAVGIYDPMDMSGHSMYPSGVKEADKYPRFALPASKLASLALPQDIYSNDGRTIKSGHYLVGLSVSKQTLLVFDGETDIFELNIDNLEILEKNIKISTIKFYGYDLTEAHLIFMQGKLKITSNVKLAK